MPLHINTNPRKSWDHDCAQRSTDADSIQALSRRYGDGVILVLPLDSGRFAIMGNDRRVVDILDELPTAEGFRKLSSELDEQLKARSRRATYTTEPNDREYARHLQRVRSEEDGEPAPRRQKVSLGLGDL